MNTIVCLTVLALLVVASIPESEGKPRCRPGAMFCRRPGKDVITQPGKQEDYYKSEPWSNSPTEDETNRETELEERRQTVEKLREFLRNIE